MVLDACTMPSECVFMSSRLPEPLPRSSIFSFVPHLPAKRAPFVVRSSWQSHLDFKSSPVRGNICYTMSLSGSNLVHLSSSLTSFTGERGGLPLPFPYLPRCRKSNLVPRASKNKLKGFVHPQMTKKPKWWWRTLACLPYLLPLHQLWIYAETAALMHPIIDMYELMTTPFLEAVGSLPKWAFLAYFIIGYFCIVRRQEWPHFFRFHVMMGLLLEIALHITGALNRITPTSVYYGKIGKHFWFFYFFSFLFTLLECIRCCLAGMYADVPLISKAAYIQIPVQYN